MVKCQNQHATLAEYHSFTHMSNIQCSKNISSSDTMLHNINNTIEIGFDLRHAQTLISAFDIVYSYRLINKIKHTCKFNITTFNISYTQRHTLHSETLIIRQIIPSGSFILVCPRKSKMLWTLKVFYSTKWRRRKKLQIAFVSEFKETIEEIQHVRVAITIMYGGKVCAYCVNAIVRVKIVSLSLQLFESSFICIYFIEKNFKLLEFLLHWKLKSRMSRHTRLGNNWRTISRGGKTGCKRRRDWKW